MVPTDRVLQETADLVSRVQDSIRSRLDHVLSRVEMDGEAGTFTFEDGLAAVNELLALFVGVSMARPRSRLTPS